MTLLSEKFSQASFFFLIELVGLVICFVLCLVCLGKATRWLTRSPNWVLLILPLCGGSYTPKGIIELVSHDTTTLPNYKFRMLGLASFPSHEQPVVGRRLFWFNRVVCLVSCLLDYLP